MLENYRVTTQLVASEVVLCSLELASQLSWESVYSFYSLQVFFFNEGKGCSCKVGLCWTVIQHKGAQAGGLQVEDLMR
jgi:hypothetical protein